MSLRWCIPLMLCLPAVASAALHVVIIEGLGGEPRYTEQFAEQIDALESAAGSMTDAQRIRVFRNGDYSRDDVLDFFATLAGDLDADDRLAILLIGHGSFDDHEYKFNIAGPDLGGNDLYDILEATPAGNVLLVNTSSSSGATLEKLSGDGRTLILATRSGAERHATRFGNYFAAALSEPTADLDKNGMVTADEAFRFAERQVSDYFERNGQLATEHPRIAGDHAARFSLARLGAERPRRADTELDRLVGRRDALNQDIDDLRARRQAMTADAYQTELLGLMLELATVEEQIETREGELAGEN